MRKKLCVIVLLVLLVAVLFAVPSLAEGDFDIQDGVLKAYNGSSSAVEIPSGVTSIANGVFVYSDVTNISIPNTVTQIGSQAFYNCKNLKSVTIGGNVTSIGDYAFCGCESLSSITLPSSVNSIGRCAFQRCSSLSVMTIPSGVTRIEDLLFSECSSLKSITLPNTVMSIGQDAFSGCSSLTSISLPNGLMSIGSSAFYVCSSLTNVNIPGSVTSIGSSAFSFCSNLTSVSIPAGVTYFGKAAFSNCGNLVSISLQSGLTSIGDNMFEGCSSLTSITLPSSLTSIGDLAFSDCSNLKSVNIPGSVTSIGESAFHNCRSLTSITLPNGLTDIKYDTFAYCKSLTSITIPDTVTSIDMWAFQECGLTSISLPNGLTYIGKSAFYGCSSLTSATLPDTVTSIGSDVFYGCNNLMAYVQKDSYAHTYCINKNIPYNYIGADISIAGAKFDSSATVGKAVGITVTTPTTAKYIAMCDTTGKTTYKTWTSGYTDSNGVRTWKVNYTFSGAGNRTMYFKASADNSTWSSLVSASVTVNKAVEAAKINSAKFDSSATVGKAVGITVTTPTSAKYIVMCSSNGAAYKTWTSGYTDSNGVRTWKVNYTFSGSGSRTMYFKASADNSTWSALVSASVTVNKAVEAAKINSAKFDSSATVGKAVGITVTTPTSAKYIAMCSSNGAAYKTWTSGYTDSNGVRTWKVNYTFSGSGNRTMYFKASADNSTWSALVSASVTVNKAVEAAKINSAKFDSSATIGKAVGITVTTPTSVKYIAMCSSNGSAYKTWTSGYTDSNGVRTWKVNYTFSGAGNRTMYFKASADNSAWSSLVSASVTVNKAAAEAKVTSATFGNDAVVGQSVAIVVKTTTSAKYVRMCSENGSTVKTWTSGYSDSGDVRTWKFTYSFSGSGYRSLTFKASADNSKYDAGVVAKVAVNPAVPVVSSASFNASSAKVSQSVGITVKTSSNATTLAMCSENGSVVKTWSASGNSTVSGNVRTWNVSYSFGGAGNRSIGFKASANGSTYGSIVTANITITK